MGGCRLGTLPRNPRGPRTGLVSQHHRYCSDFDHPCSVRITFDHLNPAYSSSGQHISFLPLAYIILDTRFVSLKQSLSA